MRKNIIKKELPKSHRIIILIAILIVFVILDILVTLCLADNTEVNIGLSVLLIIIDFIGLGYFIIQDIINIKKNELNKIHFDNDGIDFKFKFVDREEIINEIIFDVDNIIASKRKDRISNLIIKKISAEEGNGKRTLCKKIANELSKNDEIKYVDFIDNLTNVDDLRNYFLTHTFIKYQLNIVIINMKADIIDEIKKIQDKDILFIIISHSSSDESIKLELSVEHIAELIKFYENNTIKDEDAILNEAKSIYNVTNKIGNILIILKSGGSIYCNDKIFIDFYRYINNMQYYKAKEYFDTYIKDRYHDSIGKFKASYEYANIQHFLGNYDSAIETLEILKTQLSEINPNELNILKDVIILLSHIHKHVGKFLIGYELLNKNEHLFKGNINYNRHFFSLLIFSHNWKYIDKRYVSKYDYLEILKDKLDSFYCERDCMNEDYYFYETYYPIFNSYINNFSIESLTDGLQKINVAIEYYKENYKRFLTNCYFIKAEIYRHLNKWDEARENYLECYNIYEKNNDKDILYILSLTIEMIRIFYDVTFKNMPIQLDFEYCAQQCANKDEYIFHNQLFNYIKQAKIDSDIFKFLQNYFKNIINPIP